MSGARPLRIGIVAGEESGDLLAADLVRALAERTGRPVELVGVGGRALQALGLRSAFDHEEIGLIGVTAIVRDLPRLLRRIGRTADLVAKADVDCLVTVDVPDFSLRVARKVRAAAPAIPIVHYVCPSVWAWRPGRAPAMKPHVDRILCVLPFEPEALAALGGPPGIYVGHRLAGDPELAAIRSARRDRKPLAAGGPRSLLLLPGSRRSEIARLIGPFREVSDCLAARGNGFTMTIATLPHRRTQLEQATAGWPARPAIVTDPRDRSAAFVDADAAIAASGTVLLELALAAIPAISAYRLDWFARFAMRRLVSAWSAALPNLIADRPVVLEFIDEMVRPAYMARQVEQLWSDTPTRAAQMAGYAEVARRMETARPSGALAAEAVLDLIGEPPPDGS